MVHTPEHPLVAAQVEAFRGQRPVRVGSLIVTAYGDAIAPRGGTVALAGLLKLLQAFGLNPSLGRTAISRLTADGWFRRHAAGRRSFYGLSEAGQHRVEAAARRIYTGPPTGWDQTWQLVVAPGIAGERRESVRKELGWLGFGQLAPGVLIRPAGAAEALSAVLADLGRDLILIEGRSDRPAGAPALRRLAAECWNLDGVAASYAAFIRRFTPLHRALAAGDDLRPLDGLRVRLLLIHEYRKIVLRDPMLPPPLLPEGWIGGGAYELCRALYEAMVAGAEAWLSEHLSTDEGPLPPPDPGFANRFGGLDATRGGTATPAPAASAANGRRRRRRSAGGD